MTSPAQPVRDGIERVLELAATWLARDGRGHVSEEGDRVYTPDNALRRHADHLIDHLIDHLAQVEALLVGAETLPDGRHGSLVTVDADWARFTLDLLDARP